MQIGQGQNLVGDVGCVWSEGNIFQKCFPIFSFLVGTNSQRPNSFSWTVNIYEDTILDTMLSILSKQESISHGPGSKTSIILCKHQKHLQVLLILEVDQLPDKRVCNLQQ